MHSTASSGPDAESMICECHAGSDTHPRTLTVMRPVITLQT